MNNAIALPVFLSEAFKKNFLWLIWHNWHFWYHDVELSYVKNKLN